MQPGHMGIRIQSSYSEIVKIKLLLNRRYLKRSVYPFCVIHVRPPIEPSAWIVITTLAPPTDDVMHMASLPGWKVVVVGDEMTPENWR